MADLIIKGGRIITMNGTEIEDGAVVIENGLITFAGKDTCEKAEKIIDARGCAVMPGLINSHTHLPMTLFRGHADDLAHPGWTKKIQKAEMELTPIDVRAGAALGVLEMIKSGTTTFADMYIHMDEVAQVVQKTGIRAALGYGMIEELNEDARTKLKNRIDFNKKWMGKAGGRITTMFAPHSAASCSRELLIKIKEAAALDGMRIHIHVLETEDELNEMKKRYGMCSINLLKEIGFLGKNVLAAHCIWLSDDDINILKNRKVNAVHCPSSNMTLGAGIAPVPKMLDKGINVALGTDSAASGGGLDMWKEMRTASYLHKLKDPKAMPASCVIEMATKNGAQALGVNAGVIRAGCFADIIIVDIKKPEFVSLNPVSALVHGASGCDVKTTIVNGKILMEDHKTIFQEGKIIEDAMDAISRIFDRSV
ncbi:MAG: amidohydrolase family protein [Candidatus Methanoperedens sp.]|nr:amidohydrolase family protein [Candidatus Methanoperedens sp.]MCE8424911.1 amidohydrolase family protein [Candidatus Methanoperedens sp.]MCE8428709.1 amidohydrolase family protein [Candidatus Methanoperedens sp.]